MRLLICCAVFSLLSSNLYAQEHKGLLISFQQKMAPNFELYNQHKNGITPWELEASVYDNETIPIEAGA